MIYIHISNFNIHYLCFIYIYIIFYCLYINISSKTIELFIYCVYMYVHMWISTHCIFIKQSHIYICIYIYSSIISTWTCVIYVCIFYSIYLDHMVYLHLPACWWQHSCGSAAPAAFFGADFSLRWVAWSRVATLQQDWWVYGFGPLLINGIWISGLPVKPCWLSQIVYETILEIGSPYQN